MFSVAAIYRPESVGEEAEFRVSLLEENIYSEYLMV